MNRLTLYILLLTTILLAIPSDSAFAKTEGKSSLCSEQPYAVIVDVHGLRNNLGTVKAKLYGDKPEDFLVSGKKLDSQREAANQDSTILCLYAPKPGLYAVLTHHDENGNKKLDQNWIGIPIEGVGFSNNPELFLAPPNHKDVTFEVLNEQTTIDINMQY